MQFRKKDSVSESADGKPDPDGSIAVVEKDTTSGEDSLASGEPGQVRDDVTVLSRSEATNCGDLSRNDPTHQAKCNTTKHPEVSASDENSLQSVPPADAFPLEKGKPHSTAVESTFFSQSNSNNNASSGQDRADSPQVKACELITSHLDIALVLNSYFELLFKLWIYLIMKVSSPQHFKP